VVKKFTGLRAVTPGWARVLVHVAGIGPV